jgi:hypothetical protein
MTPDWLFQVLWWSAGIGGSGAVWYFLSQQRYRAVVWTAISTVVVVLVAISLSVRNDHLRREQQTALSTPQLSALADPLVSTGQYAEHIRGMPDPTTDKSTPPPTSQRLIIRENSAAEILSNLNGITLSYRFREKVDELYVGRWTREPGWHVTVDDLPSKRSDSRWLCNFKEVGSGTLIWAYTQQDISTLRLGDSATVSGKISDISRLDYVSLEDAIVRTDNSLPP